MQPIVRVGVVALVALSAVVLAGPTPGGSSSFPGSNGLIVYSGFSGGQHIWVIQPDGAGATQLTTFPRGLEYDPSWSADGTRIAFVHAEANTDVWIMNADGTGQTNLTSSAANETAPSWSPDGTKLLYTSDVDGSKQIFVMNADGTGQTNLSNAPGTDDDAAQWSPDGSTIVFVRTAPASFPRLYVMGPDGSGQAPLEPPHDGGQDLEPHWSPDGTRIAFMSDRDCCTFDIFVVDRDGTGAVNVTNSQTDAESEPTWAPDGTKLVFSGFTTGPRLFLMSTDGSDRVLVSDVDAGFPDWQPTAIPTPIAAPELRFTG